LFETDGCRRALSAKSNGFAKKEMFETEETQVLRLKIMRLSEPDTDGRQNEVKSTVTWISTVLGKSIVHIHCTWKKHSAYPA